MHLTRARICKRGAQESIPGLLERPTNKGSASPSFTLNRLATKSYFTNHPNISLVNGIFCTFFKNYNKLGARKEKDFFNSIDLQAVLAKTRKFGNFNQNINKKY
jgi:hypothetical protein